MANETSWRIGGPARGGSLSVGTFIMRPAGLTARSSLRSFGDTRFLPTLLGAPSNGQQYVLKLANDGFGCEAP